MLPSAEIEVDVDPETLRQALLRATTLKDLADARRETLEAAQFERGYN